ncbi:hypothetical protein CCP3SC5AM1_1080007 [Gammaproteobacteria bacterium]
MFKRSKICDFVIDSLGNTRDMRKEIYFFETLHESYLDCLNLIKKIPILFPFLGSLVILALKVMAPKLIHTQLMASWWP